MRSRHTAISTTISFPLSMVSSAAAAVPVQRSVNVHAPIYHPPRIVDGAIYFNMAQPKGIHVFAAKNGKTLWWFTTGGPVQTPVILGRRSQVWMAPDMGNVHHLWAIQVKTGKLIWDHIRHERPAYICSHLTHYERHLLFAQMDGHSLYAFYLIGNIPNHRYGFSSEMAPD